MSIGLLLPSALLALAALLLPLLVHLVRQSEQKRIAFAALRWLVARAQPRRRPRFNEWLLLALRLLLIALLALWLAQPVLNGRPDTRPWLVVDPAIDPARIPPAASPDEQRHWLAPGFPPLEQPAPRSTASIGSLLRELDATLPAQARLRVVVPAQFDASDAQRPLLGRAIGWLPITGTSAFHASVAPQRMRIAAFVDAAHRQALPWLRAAAAAWASETTPAARPHTLHEIATADAMQTGDTHLIWLASTALPAQQKQWVHAGGVVVLARDSAAEQLDWHAAEIAWRGADGSPLALRMGDGKGAWIRMLVPFDPQSLPALLEATFPDALQVLLAPTPPIASRTWADSYAPIQHHIAPYPQTPRPLGSLLALLIALLFGIERWLAMAARRTVAR